MHRRQMFKLKISLAAFIIYTSVVGANHFNQGLEEKLTLSFHSRASSQMHYSVIMTENLQTFTQLLRVLGTGLHFSFISH